MLHEADKTTKKTLRARNFSISDRICFVLQLNNTLYVVCAPPVHTWTTIEEREGEEKDQSFTIRRQKIENAKKVGREVKDQRISNFNCCSLSFVFIFLSDQKVNDPFHLFTINILIQHIYYLFSKFAQSCLYLCWFSLIIIISTAFGGNSSVQ